MIAMRLPLTIMVQSRGTHVPLPGRTSSTGPSTVTGSSCCGIAMVRVVVATKPLLTSIYGGKGRLFVKLFAGQHVSMHVEYRLASINSGVEDQAEGTVELWSAIFCATRAMWASCWGSAAASSATFA